MHLLIPNVPDLMAYGFLFAFAGMGALYLLAKMEQDARSRVLASLAIVLLCVGATVHASQPVTHPCAFIEPGSWLDYISGCFLGR